MNSKFRLYGPLGCLFWSWKFFAHFLLRLCWNVERCCNNCENDCHTLSLSHSSLFTVRRLCLSISLSLSPIFLLLFKFLSFCPHLCLSRSHSSVSISFLFLYLNILSFYLSLSILCVCSCPVLSLYLSLFLSFENCFEHWIHRVMLNCFRLYVVLVRSSVSHLIVPNVIKRCLCA